MLQTVVTFDITEQELERGRPRPLEVSDVLERLRRRSPLLRRHTCWIRLDTPAACMREGCKRLEPFVTLKSDVRSLRSIHGHLRATNELNVCMIKARTIILLSFTEELWHTDSVVDVWDLSLIIF